MGKPRMTPLFYDARGKRTTVWAMQGKHVAALGPLIGPGGPPKRGVRVLSGSEAFDYGGRKGGKERRANEEETERGIWNAETDD